MQAAACVGLLIGNTSDWLHSEKGWSLVRVRRVMQLAASIGGLRCLTGQTCMHVMLNGNLRLRSIMIAVSTLIAQLLVNRSTLFSTHNQHSLQLWAPPN